MSSDESGNKEVELGYQHTLVSRESLPLLSLLNRLAFECFRLSPFENGASSPEKPVEVKISERIVSFKIDFTRS